MKFFQFGTIYIIGGPEDSDINSLQFAHLACAAHILVLSIFRRLVKALEIEFQKQN